MTAGPSGAGGRGRTPARPGAATGSAADRSSGRRFLLAAAAGAALAANARRPAARQGPAAVAAFPPGWLVSELPLHVAGVQALVAARAVAGGALRRPAGWVGLALTGASVAVLAGVHAEAQRSGAVFDAALREGLGAALDAGRDPLPPAPPGLVRRRLALGPLSRSHRAWRRARDLSYGEYGRRNHLDVWARADLAPDARAPVLVQVHGGGWVLGSKDSQALPLLAHMAERGWVGVSVNYRLSPRSTWPDQIVDVKRALAWVKENIGAHGGDPAFVAVTGGSAGGHLAALAALTPGEPSFQPGFEEADTSVVAAVPFYGVYDWTNRDGTGLTVMERLLAEQVVKAPLASAREAWDRASPMSWVGPDAPPMMVVHGTNDTLVPVEQARSFAALLRAESRQPVVYAELPGAQHAFEVFASPRTLQAVAAVHRFLAAVRARDGHVADAGGEGPVDPSPPDRGPRP